MRNPGRTLLVGCGALGTALGERLTAAGSPVTAVRRTADGLPAAFTVIEADLYRPLDGRIPGIDSMVITLPPGTSTGGAPLYLAALSAIDAALVTRPSRVLFVSSTRVFEGWDHASLVTERDQVAPTSSRGDELVAGEEAAVRLFGAVVVRPAGIYGPGRDSLVRRVAAGGAFDVSRRTNRVHESDLVRLLEVLLRTPNPPSIVHAVDQEPALLGDVVAHIAEQLGLPAPASSGDETGEGRVIEGALMRDLLGTLDYPTFREGYDEMIGRGER